MDFAYYNGKITPYGEMKIPLSDRAFFFGDGVYDCMIGRCGGVYQFERHYQRLSENARTLLLDFDYTEKDILSIVRELINLSGYNEYTVYLQVTRYSERRIHYCKDFKHSNLLITLTGAKHIFENTPVKLVSREDIRYCMCNVKTLNLLPSVLGAANAEGRGCDECVFLRGDTVTECSHSNIFILNGNTLLTHPKSRYILPGIMRDNLLREAAESGFNTVEKRFGYDELIGADEVIITSTTRFARAVQKIDENSINCNEKNPIYEVLYRLYNNFLECCC